MSAWRTHKNVIHWFQGRGRGGADKAAGQLQLRRKPSSRPSLSSLQGAFEGLNVEGDGSRGGVS